MYTHVGQMVLNFFFIFLKKTINNLQFLIIVGSWGMNVSRATRKKNVDDNSFVLCDAKYIYRKHAFCGSWEYGTGRGPVHSPARTRVCFLFKFQGRSSVGLHGNLSEYFIFIFYGNKATFEKCMID